MFKKKTPNIKTMLCNSLQFFSSFLRESCVFMRLCCNFGIFFLPMKKKKLFGILKILGIGKFFAIEIWILINTTIDCFTSIFLQRLLDLGLTGGFF